MPLWVADMDFAAPKAVEKALQQLVAQGTFGYGIPPSGYFSAYQGWQDRHWGTKFEEKWLSFSTGVVQSLVDLLHCFTEPDDGILIQPPVYYPFFDSIKETKRRLIEAPLQKVGNSYRIDFAAFEAQIIEEKVKLFILCSPHNPVGRVWQEEELHQLLAICQKHEVVVIADEIHRELILGDQQFVSAITVAQRLGIEKLIVLDSPSKTFNLAGLLLSHVWIPDLEMRTTYHAWCRQYKQTEVNCFGLTAAKAAYESGDQWLADLLSVVVANEEMIRQQLQEAFPKIELLPLEGTYLLWVDLRQVIAKERTKHVIQDTAGLAVDYGEWFAKDGQGLIRLSLATTPTIIQQALDRMIEAIKKEERHDD
ncbi:cystathionine beta-lyase [Enterococcus innesii]|uniref:cysteine-S-conjugate beta-lyase n=1 Tax=Enterococcus innesii TaxID=2839759 RepID=A0ABN6NLI9_9ENTE|nr:cystathionine beta-lyase [Enterococcus innesii]